MQTLVFGWLSNPQATTEELAALAADLGVTISPQGLADHFTDPAVACLEQVLQAAIAQVIAADPLTIPLLDRFPAVLLHDRTTISLPDALDTWFRGGGGSHGQVAAALKAHLRLELRTGQVEGPVFQDGRASDRAVGFRRRPPVGALTLRDLGFFQLDDMAADQRDGRHWLSYLKPNTVVFYAGQRLDLSTFLPTQGDATVDLVVTVGGAPARAMPPVGRARARGRGRAAAHAYAEGGPRQRDAGASRTAGVVCLDDHQYDAGCGSVDRDGGAGAAQAALAA